MSSGVIYSIAGFLVQIVLAGIALILTFDEFNFSLTKTTESSDGHILLILLLIIVAIGAVVGILFAIPKVRQIAVKRPFLRNSRQNWSTIAAVWSPTKR